MIRASLPPFLLASGAAPALAFGTALACVFALSACTEEPASETAVDPGESAPATMEQMPEALLGAYDADAEACSRQTTMTQLAISPDTLRFYYGYATVDSVTARDGGYDVGATMYHLEGAVEVVPEATTYRFDPSADSLRVDAAGEVPPMSLVRCVSV